MGFRIDIEGLKTEVTDYSVSEASTPLAAGDSSGQVGTFSITLPNPDRFVETSLFQDTGDDPGYGEGEYGEDFYGGEPAQGVYGHGPYGRTAYGRSSSGVSSIPNTPWRVIREVGPQVLIGKTVRIEDPRKGFTLGTITDTTDNRESGTVQLTGVSRLGSLNVYGIQAQPFVGTLRAAFEYYLELAGLTTDLFVDQSIGNRRVVFPGWSGELWYYLKLMAAAQDCDVSLVSGVILLRPIRARIATQDRDTARSVSSGSTTLAQAVEVYQYSNRPITGELVYPPRGWVPEVEVLTVNAGETTEYTLELSASVSSIQEPVMQTFVAKDYVDSSVYTIVADDGLPVSPSLWGNSGGALSVRIGEDTTHLIVTLTGAVGVPTAAGTAAQNFSVALGSDTTGNRYSTLRIVGTGVAFNKVKKRIRTGVPAARTATDVGVTIDNPFISSTNDLYRAGTRAAKSYAGADMTLTSNVIAINRRGDSGVATYATYGQVQTALQNELGVPSYAAVEDFYTGLGLVSYEDVRVYWRDEFRDDTTNQVFGNVQGARIYDRGTRRWYRIRDATLNPGAISLGSADDDLTIGDIEELYSDLTYAGVQTLLNPFDYREVYLAGLWRP